MMTRSRRASRIVESEEESVQEHDEHAGTSTATSSLNKGKAKGKAKQNPNASATSGSKDPITEDAVVQAIHEVVPSLTHQTSTLMQWCLLEIQNQAAMIAKQQLEQSLETNRLLTALLRLQAGAATQISENTSPTPAPADAVFSQTGSPLAYLKELSSQVSFTTDTETALPSGEMVADISMEIDGSGSATLFRGQDASDNDDADQT